MTPEQLAALTAAGWQLVGIVLPIALAVLTTFAVRYLNTAAHSSATDRRGAVLKELAQVAITAVTYAQQTIAANPDKKAAALSFVNNYLAAHGINLPVMQIDAAIESAVFTVIKQGQGATVAPTSVGADDLHNLGLPSTKG